MPSINFAKLLSPEEIEACRDAFLRFDEDHSGTIDTWELKNVLEVMGQKPTDQEILHMISEVVSKRISLIFSSKSAFLKIL